MDAQCDWIAAYHGAVVYYTIITLMLIALIGVLVLLGRRRRVPPGELPKCGGCGYVVAGLPGHICPECGGDLKVVGIIRPGERLPPSKFASVSAWTLVLLLLTPLVIGGLGEIDGIIPSPWRISWHIRLTNPCSGSYRYVEVSSTDVNWDRDKLAPREVTVLLDRNGETKPELHIGSNGRVMEGEFAGEPVTALLIERWIASIGIAGDQQRIRREAGIIALAAKMPSKGVSEAIWDEGHASQMWQQSGSGRSLIFTFGNGGVGISGPSLVLHEEIVRRIMWIALGILWITGMMLIVFRRRPWDSPAICE